MWNVGEEFVKLLVNLVDRISEDDGDQRLVQQEELGMDVEQIHDDHFDVITHRFSKKMNSKAVGTHDRNKVEIREVFI